MVQSFGYAFATARVEGVLMEHGSGQKYRVKWTNLSEQQISEYGCNHRLFQDPSKERPPKVPKIHGSQPISRDTEGSSSAVSNTADAVGCTRTLSIFCRRFRARIRRSANTCNFSNYKSVIMIGARTRPCNCSPLALDSC
jgi:hypothetical protein